MQLTGSKNGGVTLGGAAQSCEFGLNFHSHSHHLDYLAYLDCLANLDHLDYFAYLAYLAILLILIISMVILIIIISKLYLDHYSFKTRAECYRKVRVLILIQ